jgi:hypothetical protein
MALSSQEYQLITIKLPSFSIIVVSIYWNFMFWHRCCVHYNIQGILVQNNYSWKCASYEELIFCLPSFPDVYCQFLTVYIWFCKQWMHLLLEQFGKQWKNCNGSWDELEYLSRYSVWLWTGWPGFDPQQGQRIFLLASASILALGPPSLLSSEYLFPCCLYLLFCISPGTIRNLQRIRMWYNSNKNEFFSPWKLECLVFARCV